MKKIFMFAGSSNCFHAWLELARQIDSAIEEETAYYVMCDAGADYGKYISHDQTEGLNIHPIELTAPADLSGYYKKKPEDSCISETESFTKRIKRFLRTRFNFAYVGLQALVRIRKICSQKRQLKSIYTEYRPDLVLFVDGVRPGYELAAIRVAAEMNISAMLAPFGCFMSPDAAVYFGVKFPRFSEKQQKSFWFRYIEKKYPANVGRVGDTVLLRYELPDLIAMGATGVLPYSPWYPGGNQFQLTGVAEQQAYDEACEHFDEEHKERLVRIRSIERTGVLRAFRERETGREKLRRDYGFAEGSIAVIAAEAIAEASYSVEYEDALTIYSNIVTELRKYYDYVLVSLHPRMHRERYVSLEEIPGCKIANERLYKIIALGDGVVVFVPKFSPSLLVEGIPLSVIEITVPEFEGMLTDKGRREFGEKAGNTKKQSNVENVAGDAGLKDFYMYVTAALKGEVAE